MNRTLLTLAGSLRAGSSNARLLELAVGLLPAGLEARAYTGLAGLPAFDPGLDQAPPPAVGEWRTAVASADAVLIATPEYAHGIPGSLKNALDWLVGSGELVGKPVGVILASADEGRFALEGLLEVLRVMGAQAGPGRALVVRNARKRLASAPQELAAELGPLLAALLADPN